MHIGLFSPDLPSTGSPNGIVTYVRVMRDALCSFGHRVTIVSHGAVERGHGEIQFIDEGGGIQSRVRNIFRAFRNKLGSDPFACPETIKLIRSVHRLDPFDVFEMEESFGWVGKVALNVPVVARLHGPHYLGRDEVEPAAIKKLSEARVFNEGLGLAKAGGITSPSPGIMAATLEKYPSDFKRFSTIYNPIPKANRSDHWDAGRCNWNQILFVGRFDLRKGGDVAVDAFIRAAKKNDELKLVICGPDPGILCASGDRIHFSEYLTRFVPLALRNRISYVGAIGSDRLSRLRQESALCLSTSRFETFSYSMAEALSVGLPLIAPATFGVAELLDHGHTGYITPVGDAGAVAATIEEALADRSKLGEIGQSGRALCEDILSPEVIAEQTTSFYQSLMS